MCKNTQANNKFSLPETYNKQQLLYHAQKLLEAQQKMQSMEGKNIVHYTLQNHAYHLKMQHYPKGDRIDHQSGAQYFYHCHRENMDSLEHGHFHCFLRYKQIPEKIKPKKIANWDKFINNPMTHIIAIAMNCYGEPIRLFSVNRWVSEEICYSAEHTSEFINRFNLQLADSSYWSILDEWVQAMLKIFAPQIVWVNQQRDLYLEDKSSKRKSFSIYDDKKVEELSSISINIAEQIRWIMS